MSKEELHKIAMNDTPEAVNIPNTLQGLIIWGVARFGVGIIIAAVFGYALTKVYEDMRQDRLELVTAYKENTKVMEVILVKIDTNTKAIEDVRNHINK